MSGQIALGLLLALAIGGMAVVVLRWSRETRGGSSLNPSSLGIVARSYGWIFGFLKLGRMRAKARGEAQLLRHIAQHRGHQSANATRTLEQTKELDAERSRQ